MRRQVLHSISSLLSPGEDKRTRPAFSALRWAGSVFPGFCQKAEITEIAPCWRRAHFFRSRRLSSSASASSSCLSNLSSRWIAARVSPPSAAVRNTSTISARAQRRPRSIVFITTRIASGGLVPNAQRLPELVSQAWRVEVIGDVARHPAPEPKCSVGAAYQFGQVAPACAAGGRRTPVRPACSAPECGISGPPSSRLHLPTRAPRRHQSAAAAAALMFPVFFMLCFPGLRVSTGRPCERSGRRLASQRRRRCGRV